jgi:hypothetical protein
VVTRSNAGVGSNVDQAGVELALQDPLDLGHLHQSAQQLARLPDDERLRHVRADRWIGYSRATAALERLETLYGWPGKQRMPNLLLIGPTNNGKSMIIEKFRRAHPPISHPDREQIPVLAVQMPSEPSVTRFYVALQAALGAPMRPRQRLAELEQATLGLLRAVGVRVLIIDELHNVLAGRGDVRPGVPEPDPLPRQRAAYPAGRGRHPRGVPGDPLRRPVGEPVRAVHVASLGTGRRSPFAAGQFRHVLPAAPAFRHRL